MDIENDWNEAIKDIKVEKEVTKFKLEQLKLEHFYIDDEDIDNNTPISTSIELTSKYNFETNKNEWKKKVSHTYIDLNSDDNTNSYEEVLENEELIRQIEKYDLRNLKNNYFTEEAPERYTYWVLTYNNKFKIVGTYDQEIDEFINIRNLLNFKEIMNEELNKLK